MPWLELEDLPRALASVGKLLMTFYLKFDLSEAMSNVTEGPRSHSLLERCHSKSWQCILLCFPIRFQSGFSGHNRLLQ